VEVEEDINSFDYLAQTNMFCITISQKKFICKIYVKRCQLPKIILGVELLVDFESLVQINMLVHQKIK